MLSALGSVMELPAAQELARLHAAWMERFGEPPPIIAEPEIMRRVLSQVLARSDEALSAPKERPSWMQAAPRGDA
jgi:hypothetical protein